MVLEHTQSGSSEALPQPINSPTLKHVNVTIHAQALFPDVINNPESKPGLVQGQQERHSEFKANLGSLMRTHLKIGKQSK